MTKEERLQAFRDVIIGKPVTWGQDDCSSWPAQWVEMELDIKIERQSFKSAREAHSIIIRSGGLANIWSDVLSPHNIRRSYEPPKIGDVGIVETADSGDVGVIFAHGGAAIWRTTNGFKLLCPREKYIVAHWSVPDQS